MKPPLSDDVQETERQTREPQKSEARRRAILEVARDAFLEHGFAATSMSEIATRLGGSKGTLYNYFRSKEELFAAIMTDLCQGPANALFDHLPKVEEDVRQPLIELGIGLLRFILRPDTMAIHRVVVGEAHRFPELGRIFYEHGPKPGQVRLAGFFAPLIERGLLRPNEPGMLGQRFKDLMLSDVYLKRIWGVAAAPTDEEIERHVTQSVDIFLAAFGPLSD